MRRGVDETRDTAEMQADETRKELRCIRSTDSAVCLTSSVCRHSMTTLQTHIVRQMEIYRDDLIQVLQSRRLVPI